MKKLTVIIPVYNEEKTIAEVIQRVREADVGDLDLEVIVVDDASQDDTRKVLSNDTDLTVILHERNLGKGGAIKTGLQVATGDIVIIQDADLEYNPEDFRNLLAPILAGDTEFVMGSRFLIQDQHYHWRRRQVFLTHYIGNKVIIWLTNILYWNRATDYEGCYKAVTRRFLSSLTILSNGFEFDNELICKALRLGCPIVEVPIRYNPRGYKDGKKITLKHGFKMLWTIIKWRVLPLNAKRNTLVDGGYND